MRKFGLAKLTCLVFASYAASIGSHAQTFTSLASFDGADGAYPTGPLVEDADGNFYGTTSDGGTGEACTESDGCGTVFELTPDGTLNTLYSFCSQAGCKDGSFPLAGLFQATDGNFYGTTYEGGANGGGTVFEITAAGAFKVLYSFCSQADCKDGSNPYGGLVEATDGNFYGTTAAGGTAKACTASVGCGTVFKITPGGALTTLYDFCSQANGEGYCSDGQLSFGGLIQATDGSFYGTTCCGGTNGLGTIFRITPEGVLTTLYNFCSQSKSEAPCADGAAPTAGLVQGTDGNFYGTTEYGGADANCLFGCAYGTIFKITAEAALTTLYSFPFCPGPPCNGAAPGAGLIQASDGDFYGTTSQGGNSGGYCIEGWGCGTVFKITPAGTLTTLYAFCSQSNCTDGGVPVAGLIQATNGTFYGTTSGTTSYVGTDSNCIGGCTYGTVFSVSVGLAGIPAAVLSPASVSFGDQALDEASAAWTVTLKNSGEAVLDINGITVNGDFAISANTCSATLATATSCEVSVTFTPKVPGERTGILTVVDNAGTKRQTVPLSGTGVEPATLTPASATYAAQKVGTTSTAKTFTLTNNQTVALTGIAISMSGDFAVSSTTCTKSLAPKEKCKISVTFKPTKTGTRTGQLRVNDSGSNHPQTANLKGTGD